MLTLRINLADPCPEWQYTDGRWHCTAGAIRPFTHPCLNTSVHQPAPGTLHIQITSADGDSTILQAQPGKAMLKAGIYATAPLFLALIGDVMHASWRMADVAQHAEPWQLSDRHITRLLTRQHRYTTDTPSAQVHRLTAGSTATIRPGHLAIEYPDAVPRISQRRTLRPGLDLVEAFDLIMKKKMASYVPDHSGTVGVELSGGADSANVALSARGLLADTPLYSVGLALPAPAEMRQSFRRLAFTVHLNLTDTAIPAISHLPFNPRGRRFAGPHDPASSYYCEAFDAVAHTAATRGVKVMLTGFGADELMRVPGPALPSLPHRPAWLGPRALNTLDQVNDGISPPTPVSAPTLMACASHSPAYLSQGIWPIAPFANTTVSRFARQLPTEWAADKRILRERLIRSGIPRLATRPQNGEEFTPVMHLGMHTHVLPLLEKLADELILAELGFIAPGPLRHALTQARETPEPDSALIDLLRLELGLRSLWHREPPRSAVSAPRDTEHRHDDPDSERHADAAALA